MEFDCLSDFQTCKAKAAKYVNINGACELVDGYDIDDATELTAFEQLWGLDQDDIDAMYISDYGTPGCEAVWDTTY